MTVFVGWSGSGGKEIAARVRKFLSDFFEERIDVNFSEQISAGDVWHSALTKMLQKANYGLLCLTPQSEPSWLLYEAGILSQTTLSHLNGSPEPHIAPILFGMDGETFRKFDPLTHYQTCPFQSDSIGKLLEEINKVSRDMTKVRNVAARSHKASRSLTPDEFDDNWDKYYDAFEKDIRRLMKANDLELHLMPFQGDATDGRALFGLGKTLVSALRMETATPDTWKAAFDKFQKTFTYMVSEEGVTLDLKPLQKDVTELKALLEE